MKIELKEYKDKKCTFSYTPNWFEKIIGEKYIEKVFIILEGKQYSEYKSRTPIMCAKTGDILFYTDEEVITINNRIRLEKYKHLL